MNMVERPQSLTCASCRGPLLDSTLRGTPFKVLHWLLSLLVRGRVRGCGDGKSWLYSPPKALTRALSPESFGGKGSDDLERGDPET